MPDEGSPSSSSPHIDKRISTSRGKPGPNHPSSLLSQYGLAVWTGLGPTNTPPVISGHRRRLPWTSGLQLICRHRQHSACTHKQRSGGLIALFQICIHAQGRSELGFRQRKTDAQRMTRFARLYSN
ncbi:hypothetical protein L596_007223 [Steinernema carpocapsae]|uniref:Uncharacterized protein n=1 Tax=Steinernema carpocapsae TaxID=34508 RepID=A0A4U5P8N0_STECR|nr:hypothetical protein L596_007223 [Steinernema carpocapsae]